MIRVIATAKVKPGKRSEFLEILNANVPNVQNENGCLEYVAVTDFESGLENQSSDENEVLILEKWESLDALKAHLKTPHMEDFRNQAKDVLENVTLRILS